MLHETQRSGPLADSEPRSRRLPVGYRIPLRQDRIRRNDRIGECWLQVYLWLARAIADSLEEPTEVSSACVGPACPREYHRGANSRPKAA